MARNGLCCCGGLGSIGVAIVAADCVSGGSESGDNKVAAEVGGDMVPAVADEGVVIVHRDCWKCCIFFISLSFCVSANLTTSGAEQPSMVWLWCRA